MTDEEIIRDDIAVLIEERDQIQAEIDRRIYDARQKGIEV